MDAEEILTSLNTGNFAWFQWTAFLKLAFIYMRGVWPVFGIMFLGKNNFINSLLFPCMNTYKTLTVHFSFIHER